MDDLLFRSGSQVLLGNAKNLVKPCRLIGRGMLSAGKGRISGTCAGFLAFERGWKRGRCLVARRRHGFAIFAMSESRDGSHMPSTSSKYPCMYVKRTVTSGETIQYPGTVIVFGDVLEGGAIAADGDVVVLGRLHGDVHGGRKGDTRAVVYASQLDACRIRIADAAVSVSKAEFSGCPVIASVQEDRTLGIRAAVQEANGRASLKRPAQLALFTGVYISLVGTALLLFPTSLFGVLFDVRSVTVGWIRVGAILSVVFGVYYIGTAVGDLRGSSGARAFYMSTVVGRVFLFFGFCWLVAVGAAQRALLLLGIVNMLGAMSMLVALRQDSKPRVTQT